MATLAHINRRIAESISPLIELERGEGYMYFVFDNGEVYETRSIPTPYIKDQTLFQWLEDARHFAADMGEI